MMIVASNSLTVSNINDGIKGDRGGILGENQWIGHKYSYPESTRIYPNFDYIKGLNPIVTQIFDDSTRFSFNDDYYLAHFQSNLYVNIDKQITTTVSHDDDLTIYCNDEVVVSKNTTINTPYNITFNLKAGWNKIDVLLHEISGGDQVAFGTKLSSLVEHLSYIKGPKGDTGDTGAQGATTYTWIKYATDSSGSNISDSPTGMSYIGIAHNKTTSSESSTATDYKWSLIKGDQGIQGKTGADGKTSYFHIAYANSSDGSIGFTTSPSASASYNYMGTYSDYTSTSSQSYSSYKWVAMFDSTKKRNFTTQPTTPYAVGDTWTQSGATYFCTTARNSGALTASDWTMQQLTIQSMDSSVTNSLYNDNLLTGTGQPFSMTGTNIVNQCLYANSLANSYNVSSLASALGTHFTVSFDWSVSGSSPSGSFNAQWSNIPWNIVTVATVSSSNTSGHFSSTFSVSTDSRNVATMLGFRLDNFVGTLTVSNLKLEKGSVATPWCLSQSEITTTTGTYKGVTLNDAGLTATAGSTTVAMNSTDGFLIKNTSGQVFHVDTAGNLTMQGDITAGNISGVNFAGDSLTLAGILNVTGSISAGDTYPSLLDGNTRHNVILDTSGMQTGDVYASDLDYADYVTVGSLTKSTTNTANTSTTATADVTSPTLFTIDGSKLSDGDRVLVKLDINYSNYEGKLGSLIALQSVSSSPVSFSSQSLTTGFYTYSFIIKWSTALGTGKVNFQLKSTGLQANSNFYVVGANLYTNHGTGTTNYYETSGGLDADGSIRLKDYYLSTNQDAINKIYHGYEWNRGVLRLSEYDYDYNVGSSSTAPYYETQLSGSGIRFLGASNDPVLEFFGDVSHESLIAALGYEPWGIDYTGARNIATGAYFDQYGNIHGYPNSKAWKITSYGVDNTAMNVAIDNNMTSPSSWYAPGPLRLRSMGQSTELYMGQKNVVIDNPANSNSSNYDVKLEIHGYIEMTGWLTCKGLTQTSLLSKKTNISTLDTATALSTINKTGIYSYQFKSDVDTAGANAKHHYSPIIDDVNTTPQYATPNQFIAENNQGRDDGDILGYAVAAIQELSKQVDTLKQQLAAK